jgi:hypothetical protein
MQLNVRDVHLTDEWICNHQKERNKLLIPDPWNDAAFRKNGLYQMYIIDTIIDILDFPIEVKGSLNPQYTIMHNIIEEFLTKPSLEQFLSLMQFLENFIQRKIDLIRWKKSNNEPFIVDIRLLDTIDECVSWLKLKL